MKTMLDILKERLPNGLEITRSKDRRNSSQVEIWFRYQGYVTRGELQKVCAPGYAEKNCDFTINNAMLSIALKKGDADMAEFWRDRILSHNTEKQIKPTLTFPNQSPHQHFVGQTFTRDGCRMLCLAAHEDAILILQYGASEQPTNYVVCHGPEIGYGTLTWSYGNYFTIKDYENAGRSNPMSAALSAAMDRLLDSSLLEFHFDPVEDEPDNQSVYVLIHGKLDPHDLAEIEDSISSYLESMNEYGFEKLVEDVMNAHRTVSYRIIQPDHTFHI